MGHWLVALGLLSFVNSSTFGLLICARLVYALGASALLTSLTAGIALFTPLPPAPPAVVTTPAAQIAQDSRNADPIDVLLLSVAREAPVMRDVESSEIAQAKPEVVTSGSFVGIIGAIAGCGALVAGASHPLRVAADVRQYSGIFVCQTCLRRSSRAQTRLSWDYATPSTLSRPSRLRRGSSFSSPSG